jgi:hypothetical protein
MGEGEYIVGVEIRCGGEIYRDYFKLCNTQGSFKFAACEGERREYDRIWKTRELSKMLPSKVHEYDEIDAIRTKALAYIFGALFLMTLAFDVLLDWTTFVIGGVFLAIAILQLIAPFGDRLETWAKKFDRLFSGALYIVTVALLLTDVIDRFRDRHTLLFWAVLSCLVLMIFLIAQDIWFSVKRARKEAKEFGLKAALNTNFKRLIIVFVMISLVSFVRNITFIISPVWWFVLAVVVFLTASLLSRLLKQG